MSKLTHCNFAFDAAAISKGFDINDAMKNMTMDSVADALVKMGVSADESALKQFAQDDGLALGAANIPAFVQFFQIIRPDTIRALYRGRTAKQTFGVSSYGDWTTEIITTLKLELTGSVSQYSDFNRAPLSSYTLGAVSRNAIRYEAAEEVSKLEEAIAAKMRVNAKALKHDATILNIDIFENDAFWYGVNFDDGAKTYGVLTDPAMTGRVTQMGVDITSADTTVKQITDEFNNWFVNLAVGLQGNIDPKGTPIRLLMPLKWSGIMNRVNDYMGYSPAKWLTDTYKNVEIKYCVELDTADSGEPMCMLYVPQVDGVGVPTIELMQTSMLRLVGAVQYAKTREEAYSGSIAGALVACPLAVQCYTLPA